MNATYVKRFGLGVMMAALAGGVSAGEPNSDDANLLRGPVVEAGVTDNGDTMSGESSRGAQRDGARERDVPFRAYLGAVRSLHKAAKENPELALTEEQKEQIKAIAQAHKEKMQAFMEAHEDELAEFRGKRGRRGEHAEHAEHGRRGGPSGEMDDEMRRHGEDGVRPSAEHRKQMREKMGALMATAPSDRGAKKQIWEVLTAEQQEAVKANMQEMRANRRAKVEAGVGQRGRRGGDAVESVDKEQKSRRVKNGRRGAKIDDAEDD